MSLLISKTQYANFEPGEFIEEKERTYEETVGLIEQFPWQEQRLGLRVDLTNPSVTIEGKNNDFLKLAVYYNGKFVLRYLGPDRALFTKSLTDIKDAYKYLEDFFLSDFETVDFKKENTWRQDNLKHFVTRSFYYAVDKRSAVRFLLSTSGINFVFFIVMSILMLLGIDRNGAGMLVLLLLILYIGGGLNLVLFFQYYNYARSRVLEMSKGNDHFYFGHKKVPVRYDKRDIGEFVVYKSKGKSPVSRFSITEILFKNGTSILIPNILLGDGELAQKLFEYTRVEEGGIPFLPKRKDFNYL